MECPAGSSPGARARVARDAHDALGPEYAGGGFHTFWFGKGLWGDQPWFESAFLGGRASLRGYSRNRFAGNTSLYGGIEARAWLFHLNIPTVPLRIGVLGLADIGRVWLEGEESDECHETWGVGGMIQPLATPFVLTGAMAKSPEQTKLYFGSGFFF